MYPWPCNGVFTLKRHFLFALSLAFLTFAALPAMAQDTDLPEVQTYDPTFMGRKNETADQIRSMQKQSLSDKGFIAPKTVQVDIVSHPYMEDGQFGLQMSVPDVVSGCYTLTPLEYEAKFVDPYFLDIKVKKYRRIAPEGSAATAKCEEGNKMSTALMVLDKNDLLTRGTKEIRFSNDVTTDVYKLIIGDTDIELVPRSMVIFKSTSLSGPLKDRIIHTFKGNTVIALQVPMAQQGEDLSYEIMRFAASRALSPVDAKQPAAWAGNGRAVYYFYDNGGTIRSLLGDNAYAEVGTLTTNRPYDGEQGRTATAVELSVFATRPGTQL